MAGPLDPLFEDPSFLTGVSLLGGRNQDIGMNIARAQAAVRANQLGLLQQQALQGQLDKQKRQEAFNPAPYLSGKIDRGGLAMGALQSGYEPQQIGALVNSLAPRKSFTSVAPGASLIDLDNPEAGVAYQSPAKETANPTVVGLRQLMEAKDALPDGDPRKAIYGNMIDQLTGQNAKDIAKMRSGAKVPTGYMDTGGVDANGAPVLAPIPGGPADAAAEARKTAADAKKSAQLEKAVVKFSNDLTKSKVPEFEEKLKRVESLFGQYPQGELPGIGGLVGAVPDYLMPQKARDVRQAVQDALNLQIYLQAGAQTSGQEIARQQKALGSSPFASEASLRTGIENLRKSFNAAKQNISASAPEDVYQEYVSRGGMELPRGVVNPATGQQSPTKDAAPGTPGSAFAVQPSRQPQNFTLDELKAEKARRQAR